MSRVTFEAGRWPLVAGLPLPKASHAGDRVMTAGEWVFLLANGGGCEGNGRWERGTDLRRRWRTRDDRKEERSSRDSVWDLLPGSLTGRTRNGSNPLADSIRLGPTLTWTKDSIWAAQPIEVTPRRALTTAAPGRLPKLLFPVSSPRCHRSASPEYSTDAPRPRTPFLLCFISSGRGWSTSSSSGTSTRPYAQILQLFRVLERTFLGRSVSDAANVSCSYVDLDLRDSNQ